ncbi:MAG TPA: hypothetical protein VFN37_11530 [Candidatus Baltobacteraceae bacterium]|nr:hypothetical protein [Candidatus Baltobacteraceae bacterium]
MNMKFWAAGVPLAAIGLAAAIELFLVYGRPPQPLALGTIQWTYEAGTTVDAVTRAAQIGTGAHAVHAKGIFYIVHARIVAPFGLRPTWDDRDVEVRTFAHTGATMPEQRFSVDEPAQAALDRLTRRPGPVHLVRGAQQHEDLVFDLPRNVEQPALLFLPANNPARMLDLLFLHFWSPHRFNLRYD